MAKAYRLETNKDLEIVNNSWLYDIDDEQYKRIREELEENAK